MKFKSILTNIKFGFAFTLILFSLVFFAFIDYSNKEQLKLTSNTHDSIAQYIHQHRLPPPEVKEYVENLKFKTIHNHREVIENASYKIGSQGIDTVQYKGDLYLFINTPRFRLGFKDLNTYENNYYGHILFGILLLLIIFSYTWIINALAPLTSLRHEIQRFSNGELNIDCRSTKEDEIAQLGNEFDNAVKKISLLLNSRQLFLRTIMHELKTPIAKGRIVSELIQDEKHKNRMITIFEKLNLQINDFAKIEQIVSNSYDLNLNNLKLNIIIENSIELLMLENSNDKIKLENINLNKKLLVDLSLFSMAVKNLIDNGLKYSSNKEVIIRQEDNQLLFITKGEKLSRPLCDYLKAFHNDTSSKNHGMGLGLYIVYSILEMHNMDLEYEYNKEDNIFKIIF